MKTTCILFLIFLVSGCISIKSEYPAIEYYRLSQEPPSVKNLGKIPDIILLRDISVSEENDQTSLVAIWDSTNIQKYFYHRWISDPSGLLTDFFITRFDNSAGFSSGIVKTGTSVVPDYVLEGRLLELNAYSSKKSNGKNYVSVSMQFDLQSKIPLSLEKNVIFNQTYNMKIPRTDNSAASVAPAVSKAVSQIADKLMLDVQMSIAKRESK
jgi:ABC-type uncharacterized transport system auxiliary subunit